ncbi:MAG: efflux RND transporter permease subunit [Saprospiraceae bacterium]|nr:efflux RND transporter permease subunit [Saprospiraceae bacterium]
MKKSKKVCRRCRPPFKGSNEIVFAIISTTVSLSGRSFTHHVPPGLSGRLFREFGVVVAGAVLISALVSLTLTPMMSAYLLKSGRSQCLVLSEKQNRFFWNEQDL